VALSRAGGGERRKYWRERPMSAADLENWGNWERDGSAY